jgi:hypothetical protein
LIPEQWLYGDIIPIFKNKGDKSDPKNYRPITIVSCFGKLFTSVLNNRLNKFSNQHHFILENQGGFRKGYSTNDNLFILHILIHIMKKKKKKLYCAFIDFAKAFDTVWRNESGRFGALKSDSTHHFFRNACTKSGSLRFSQFSGC